MSRGEPSHMASAVLLDQYLPHADVQGGKVIGRVIVVVVVVVVHRKIAISRGLGT